MYPAPFCHSPASSSSSENRGSYLQRGKQWRSNDPALWSAHDFHYQLLSQFLCPSPPRHANNVKETITNSLAMAGLLVFPFAQNTNSWKLHPYQGKIRSKKGAYKSLGNSEGMRDREKKSRKEGNKKPKKKNQRKGEPITKKNTRARERRTFSGRPSLSSSSPPSPSSSPGKAFLFPLFLHLLLLKKKTRRR